jgi:hypothetical protein
MLRRTDKVYEEHIVLHSLLPCQTQEAVDSSSDAEYQRSEPKGIDRIFKQGIVTSVGVLQCGGSDGREERRHSRQVKEVGSSVLLRKPDGGDA